MKSVVNNSVGGKVCCCVESDVSGAAVRSRMSGSVSGDQGLNMFEHNVVISVVGGRVTVDRPCQMC